MRVLSWAVAIALLACDAGLAPDVVSAAGEKPVIEKESEVSDCWATGGDFDRAYVLGSPRRSVKGVRQAGVVEIRGPRQRTLSSSQLGLRGRPRQHFGAATAVSWTSITSGDFCRDLVIGVPGAHGGRGAVAIVPDFGRGLEPGATVWLPVGDLALQPGDRLGASVTVAQESVESGEAGFALIAAGAPGRDVAGARDAGEVISWVVPRTEARSWSIRPSGPRRHVEGMGGVPGGAERNDRFGSVLASADALGYADILVGAPLEDVGGKRDAGAVSALTFTHGRLSRATQLWQGHGLPGRAAKGDHLGAAITDGLWAIGIPGKNSNGRKDSGALIVGEGDTSGKLRVITQNTKGVPGRSERGDGFGSAVAVAVGLRVQEGWSIAVGVPGEDIGGSRDAGAVTYVDPDFPEMRFGAQRVHGLAKGDRFGSSFAVAGTFGHEEDAYEQLVIGAPGEDRPGARNAGRYYAANLTFNSPRRLAKPLANGVSSKERFGGLR